MSENDCDPDPSPACVGADGYVEKLDALKIAKKYHWKERSFRAELKALLTVRSPWVVRLAASFVETRCCWLELYDVDLMQVLQESSPVDARDDHFKLDIATSLLRALEACHCVKIVHRDVKPENILVRIYPRRYVLCDFGRSVFLGEEGCAHQVDELRVPFSGTYSYAAPEALEGICRCSNDCWSAGVVIYAALERQMPFDDTTDDERRRLPRSPSLDKTCPWPPWAESVLQGLLGRVPEVRWTASRALVALRC